MLNLIVGIVGLALAIYGLSLKDYTGAGITAALGAFNLFLYFV